MINTLEDLREFECNIDSLINNDWIEWRYISRSQKLSESFIEKYKNKVK